MIVFYLLVSVMPLVQHPLWSDFVGDLTMIKWLGSAAFLYALIYLPLRRRPPAFLDTAQARCFLLFSGLAIVSYLWLGVPGPFEVSPFMSYLSFILLFVVTLSIVDSVPRVRYVLLVAMASIAYASLHLVREWQKYGGMAAGYRPGWMTGDPNYYSLSAILCLPVAFRLLSSTQPVWERWFCMGSLAVTLLATTLAASRGGFVALVAAAGLVAWRSAKRFRFTLVATCVFTPLLFIAPSSPLDRIFSPTQADHDSAEIRTLLWNAGLRMIESHPLVGIGVGNFKAFVPAFHGDAGGPQGIAHNAYIEIAAEMGLPGLVLFGAMLWFTFRSLAAIRRRAAGPDGDFLRRAATGIEEGLFAFLVAAFFISAEYQKLFWLFIFLTMAMTQLATAGATSAHLLADPRPPSARSNATRGG